jgi:hypothetical protein
MANMSYCRFRNTLTDLRDCIAALRYEDGFATIESRGERDAADQLYKMASEFRATYEEALEDEAAAVLNRE